MWCEPVDSMRPRCTRVPPTGIGPILRRGAALLLAILAAPLPAQVGTLRFDRITVEDGLSHNSVLSIHQDSQGFLWLGTSDGLHRYDGYSFRIYRHDPEDPDSLSDSGIWAIHEDREGELWIATRGGGLNTFNRSEERFVQYRSDPADATSLSHDNVSRLFEDRAGTLWIGTGDGLNRFHRHTGTFTRYLHEPDDRASLSGRTISGIFEDRNGELWIATDTGLNRLDRETQTFVRYLHDPTDPQSLSHDNVQAIEEDPDGYLWIATLSGLNRFDRRSETFVRYLHDPSDPRSLSQDWVNALLVDRTGELWVGTKSGVTRLDRRSGTFALDRGGAADAASSSEGWVISMYEDRTGVLWFGTNDGLVKYDRSREQFGTYRQLPGGEATLSGVLISAIHEDSSGALWIGTSDNGLTTLDRRRHTYRHYTSDPSDAASLQDDTVIALHVDRSNVLWVGTWGGLDRFDREREEFIHYQHDPQDPESLSNDLVHSLYEDSSGRLWVGTFVALNRFDKGSGRFIRYADAPNEPKLVYSICEDRSGTLWFGSFTGGLYRLDSGAERFERLHFDAARRDSLSSDKVSSVHADRSGILWVGTYGGGLNRLDPQAEDSARRGFVHYRERDGLASDTIMGILGDDEGNLWLSSTRGLSRFDPRAESFTNYDVDDGLQGTKFLARSAFRSSSGEMFFGGSRGFNAFFPDHIENDPHVPPIVITDFQLFNESVPLRRADPTSPLEKPISMTRELTLTHRDYALSLEFAALHYASPRSNRYAYRLEGFDRGWIHTDSSKRFAHYSNLDAGEYVFRVKASNGDGVWNEDGVAVRIVVLPPPWKTWWAYALYAAAFAAVALSYVRAQRAKVERERAINRQLRQVDRLKDEFLANTSHELRTPLYGITGLAESLIDGAAGELPEAAKAHLGMLVASGRRLTKLVGDILDFSKLKHQSLELDLKAVDLHALVDVVLALLRPLVGSKDLELRNGVARDLPPALADEGRLEQILHNLVGNAIKFTDAGEVEVAAAVHQDRLQVRVRDTGIGIPEEKQEEIFEAFAQADASIERELGGTGLGLAVTRQLLELHDSVLGVSSTPGEGATFVFDLPIATAMPATPPAESLPAGVPVARLPVIEAAAEELAPGATGESRGFGEDSASILVVDDEPVNRQILVNQLAAQGYEISQAASGPEALRQLEKRPSDLVLLDVMMPRMSGYEVCRSLRARHGFEELPVIFLTARTQVEDLVVGLAAGANDYLPKPISKSELVARVRTHLALLFVNRQLSHLVAERTAQVTERERLLAERELLIGELKERNAELARFNYTISHDLKNPLVTIKNFLGLLRRDAAAGRAESLELSLDHLEAAADRMQRLLEELLEFSRVGHQVNPPQEVRFGDLVSEAVRELAGPIDERSVKIEVAADLPAVYGDRARLRDVVRHLLDNAVTHLGDQPAPRVAVGAVTTDRREEGAHSGGPVFYVRDNGRGIDPCYHDKVFGLFERLDPEASEGTGIGLALAKRIVEVHGGSIWVESEGAGRGSTFCFTLADAGDRAACPRESREHGASPRRSSPPTRGWELTDV